jgi:hypothetical protein
METAEMKASPILRSLLLLIGSAGAQATVAQIFAPQNPPPAPNSNNVPTHKTTFSPMPTFMQVITGAPYCAEQHAQHFKTDADGTQHNSGTEGVLQICRDSKGRTFQENQIPFIHRGENRPDIFITRVRDPISGFQYIVDPANHVAHRFSLKVETAPAPGAARGPSPQQNSQKVVSPPDPKRPISSTISLGTQIFEGEPTDGRRTIITYPTGSHGNDAPFSQIYEVWISPYLKVPMLTKTSDPLTFDAVIRLTKITRNEPDPNLFIIPSDYKIVDEVGPFDITWYSN